MSSPLDLLEPHVRECQVPNFSSKLVSTIAVKMGNAGLRTGKGKTSLESLGKVVWVMELASMMWEAALELGDASGTILVTVV